MEGREDQIGSIMVDIMQLKSDVRMLHKALTQLILDVRRLERASMPLGSTQNPAIVASMVVKPDAQSFGQVISVGANTGVDHE